MRRKLLAVMTCVAVLGLVHSGGVFALSDESNDDLSEDPALITPCPQIIEPGETPTSWPTTVTTTRDNPTEDDFYTPTPTPPTMPDPCN